MCRKIGSILKSRDLLENLSHYYFGLSHPKVLPGSEQYVILNELRRQVQLWNMRYRCSARPYFSGPFIRKLLHQLFGCSDFLEILWLDGMNLKPIERDLDELLEDIVPHHEAGSAHRKLRLWLGKDLFDNYDKEEMYRTNLSEVFVEKWMNRCDEVWTMDCEIYP